MEYYRLFTVIHDREIHENHAPLQALLYNAYEREKRVKIHCTPHRD